MIFAGEEYGTGSSRDWAAKGTQLLGIKAVIARSFERIHRSNLVGMGVLPLQFKGSDTWQSLRLNGEELIDVIPDPQLRPQSDATLVVTRPDGSRQELTLTLRIDTPIEVDYYRHGGILPFVLQAAAGGLSDGWAESSEQGFRRPPDAPTIRGQIHILTPASRPSTQWQPRFSVTRPALQTTCC